MTTRNQCPDCNSGLKPPYTSCKCGWVEPAKSSERVAEGSVPTLSCDTPGCGGAAFARNGEKNECRRCYEGNVNSRAFERCKAMGLNTVEDMRAYCRRMAKEIFRNPPSGDAWIENLKQPTVDLMVHMGTESDRKVLERARRACVIDSAHKVIPVEKRAKLRAERAARIEEQRRRAEALLKAQREEIEAMERAP